MKKAEAVYVSTWQEALLWQLLLVGNYLRYTLWIVTVWEKDKRVVGGGPLVVLHTGQQGKQISENSDIRKPERK